MTIDNHPDLALPKGSLILVTGATGFIAANIVREALDLGYRVRGTARSQEKVDVTRKVFNSLNYEGIVVPEMDAEGAYDEAVKGVDAVIHTASPVIMSPDPAKVIDPAVKGATSIMFSALREPAVKRFVFTSSSTAATDGKPGQKFKIDRNTWNTEIEGKVKYDPPWDERQPSLVYSTSKLEAERAVWKFVKEQQPKFVVNAILPNYNMGRILVTPGFTANLIIAAYNGNVLWFMPPQHMIDVIDDARIHIAAAIDQTVANERVFAFATPFNWNDVLDVFRELRPNKTFVENRESGFDLSEPDNKLGEELLLKWWGQKGYTSMKESLRQNIQGLD